MTAEINFNQNMGSPEAYRQLLRNREEAERRVLENPNSTKEQKEAAREVLREILRNSEKLESQINSAA